MPSGLALALARQGPPTAGASRRIPHIPGVARPAESLCGDFKKRWYVCSAGDESSVGT